MRHDASAAIEISFAQSALQEQAKFDEFIHEYNPSSYCLDDFLDVSQQARKKLGLRRGLKERRSRADGIHLDGQCGGYLA